MKRYFHNSSKSLQNSEMKKKTILIYTTANNCHSNVNNQNALIYEIHKIQIEVRK